MTTGPQRRASPGAAGLPTALHSCEAGPLLLVSGLPVLSRSLL